MMEATTRKPSRFGGGRSIAELMVKRYNLLANRHSELLEYKPHTFRRSPSGFVHQLHTNNAPKRQESHAHYQLGRNARGAKHIPTTERALFARNRRQFVG